MTAHELAHKLLELPDIQVCVYDADGSTSMPVESISIEQKATTGYEAKKEFLEDRFVFISWWGD